MVAATYTEFTVDFSEVQFAARTRSLLFRIQWTRVCFSFNSNSSMAALEVDGDQLGEKVIVVDGKHINLNMIIRWDGDYLGTIGNITDVNIFSASLSNMTEVNESIARADIVNCGAPGDYLSWDSSLKGKGN